MRESRSVVIPPAMYERMLAVARSHLGESAFEEARARGRTLTAAQALTLPEAFTLQTLQQAQAVPRSAPIGHPSSPAGLTPREMEVLQLLAQGLTSAQIAKQLVIGVVTVNFHVRSIYSKLGVTSRSATTRYALEHHLLRALPLL